MKLDQVGQVRNGISTALITMYSFQTTEINFNIIIQGCHRQKKNLEFEEKKNPSRKTSFSNKI